MLFPFQNGLPKAFVVYHYYAMFLWLYKSAVLCMVIRHFVMWQLWCTFYIFYYMLRRIYNSLYIWRQCVVHAVCVCVLRVVQAVRTWQQNWTHFPVNSLLVICGFCNTLVQWRQLWILQYESKFYFEGWAGVRIRICGVQGTGNLGPILESLRFAFCDHSPLPENIECDFFMNSILINTRAFSVLEQYPCPFLWSFPYFRAETRSLGTRVLRRILVGESLMLLQQSAVGSVLFGSDAHCFCGPWSRIVGGGGEAVPSAYTRLWTRISALSLDCSAHPVRMCSSSPFRPLTPLPLPLRWTAVTLSLTVRVLYVTFVGWH
jgi:hypothetical protein